MALLNLASGYFGITSPWRGLDRRLHRLRHRRTVRLNGRDVEVRWTARADRALRARREPLVVELRLYFACVVQKRVLFHADYAGRSVAVRPGFAIAFRPLASPACDPVEFAANHPPGLDLGNGAAARMVPRRVDIDFRNQTWEGQFRY